MNKFQKQIVKEEFARAAMIKTAKESLGESAFRGFVTEMFSYENDDMLTEGIEPQDKYNNFLGQLMEQTATVQPPRTRIANTQGTGTGNVTAELEQEPDDGGGNPKKNNKKQNSNDPKQFPKTLSDEAVAIVKKKGISNPREVADFVLSNKQVFDDRDEVEAVGYLRFALGNDYSKVYDEEGNKKGGGGGSAPAKPSGNVKKDTESLGKELESPKAKGILGSIFDSYKFAFASNAKMWEKVYDFINGVGDKSPAEQETAAGAVEDELEAAMPDPPESAEEAEEEAGEEEGGGTISIRKGKGSLQSRISKLFPDLAKKKGTYYYRQTDKEGDQGRIISKNTSALAAILGDIEAQLKGSGIDISESLRRQLIETVGTMLLSNSNGMLLESQTDLKRFKTNLQVALQKVAKNKKYDDDPKKKKKAIQKFLFRLKNYAEKGDFATLASRYDDITAVKTMERLYAGLDDEEKEKSKEYALAYSKKQFTGSGEGRFKSSTLDDAKKDAPSKSKEQMIKMVPKIRSGIVNISQIIGPKLKAAGYDLKSPEGAKVQQRLLKVLRRYLTKELERIGMTQKVKLLAKFSKSNPKKDKSVNESIESMETSYINHYSVVMLEGIMYELRS